MRTAFIVPKGGKSTLLRLGDVQRYREGAPPLVEMGPVPMPPLAPHALDLDEDLLVYADGRSMPHRPRRQRVQFSKSATLASMEHCPTSIVISGHRKATQIFPLSTPPPPSGTK